MNCNFDEMIDRTGTDSMKVDCIPDGIPEDHLSLWMADMDFSCSEPVLRALHDRVDQKILGYSNYGNDVKEATVSWFKRRFDWEIDPDTMFFSPGVVPAISLLINALTDPGDGIIIQRPVYYPFTVKIESNGRRAVNNPLKYIDGRYEIDFEDLEKKLADPGNKGLLFCSPHNPVGRVWTPEELKTLVGLCKKYGKWIVSDEIHCDLTRLEVRHYPLPVVADDYLDQIIVCTAPTKTFNLAGLGISNIVIHNPGYQEKYNKALHQCLGVDASPFGIAGTVAAYNECEGWLDRLRAYIDENIVFVHEFVEQHFPKARMTETEGTYLVWIDFNAYCSDIQELENWTRRKAGVILDEGYVFGEEGNGFERINVASPRAVIEDCMNRLLRTFPELAKKNEEIR